jgi:hypothetical protein
MSAPTTEFTPVTTTSPPAAAALNEVSDPKATLDYLRTHVGLSVRELAQVLGADERTVRRWTMPSEQSALQQRFAERIDDLRDLVRLLGSTLPGEQTGRWLRARNHVLKGGRPLELLADGQYERVRDAAEAFVDGDPL